MPEATMAAAAEAPVTTSTPAATTAPTTTQQAPAPNTPEARTADGTIKDAGAPTAPETKSATPPAAPVEYKFTAPEGKTYDQANLDRAIPIFKELGLTQDAANKLVELQSQFAAEWATKQAEAVRTMREGWTTQLKADKDIGSKLPEVGATIGAAKNLLKSDTRAAFEETMNATGIGDHPAFVKAFYELATLATEGKHVTGGNPSVHGQSSTGTAGPKSLASAMYPNLPSRS